jgi:hypothetical protein
MRCARCGVERTEQNAKDECIEAAPTWLTLWGLHEWVDELAYFDTPTEPTA